MTRQGSSQLREATTTPVMIVAVMPVESASESMMILAIFQRDMSHPVSDGKADRSVSQVEWALVSSA